MSRILNRRKSPRGSRPTAVDRAVLDPNTRDEGAVQFKTKGEILATGELSKKVIIEVSFASVKVIQKEGNKLVDLHALESIKSCKAEADGKAVAFVWRGTEDIDRASEEVLQRYRTTDAAAIERTFTSYCQQLAERKTQERKNAASLFAPAVDAHISAE